MKKKGYAKKVSKVKDLLRESRETAFNMNLDDLDQMFNLRMFEDGITPEGLDKTSQTYLNKIVQLREMQKKILPLYLESKKLVFKHQKCLSTILNENNELIPF